MDFDERHSMLEEDRMVNDLQLCESCNDYHPHYDFVQNTKGQFICPTCVELQACEVCSEIDPSTSVINDDGMWVRACDGCYEKMSKNQN